jgi:hypothetical protein
MDPKRLSFSEFCKLYGDTVRSVPESQRHKLLYMQWLSNNNVVHKTQGSSPKPPVPASTPPPPLPKPSKPSKPAPSSKPSKPSKSAPSSKPSKPAPSSKPTPVEKPLYAKTNKVRYKNNVYTVEGVDMESGLDGAYTYLIASENGDDVKEVLEVNLTLIQDGPSSGVTTSTETSPSQVYQHFQKLAQEAVASHSSMSHSSGTSKSGTSKSGTSKSGTSKSGSSGTSPSGISGTHRLIRLRFRGNDVQFRRYPNDGNGHCLFYSIIHLLHRLGLRSNTYTMQQLRDEIADYVMTQKDETVNGIPLAFQRFMFYDTDASYATNRSSVSDAAFERWKKSGGFDKYTRGIRKSQWGRLCEILAASELFGINFYLHTFSRPTEEPHHVTEKDGTVECHLLYLGHNHYEALERALFQFDQ